MPRPANTISHQGLERWGKQTTVKIAGRGPGTGCYPGSCTAGDYTYSCPHTGDGPGEVVSAALYARRLLLGALAYAVAVGPARRLANHPS